MRPWCQWQLEPLLRLIMGICLLLATSAMGTMIVLKLWGTEEGAADFSALLLHTLVFHGGVVVMVAWFLGEHRLSWSEAFGVRVADVRDWIGWALLATVVCLVCAQLLGRFSGWLIETVSGEEPALQTTVELLRESSSPFRLLYMGLVTVVMAPIAEELLFRGVLYPAVLQHQGRLVAMAGTSAVFGLIHANLLTMLPLFAIAMVLTVLYERTRNLLAPILAHALFNLANFLMLLREGETV